MVALKNLKDDATVDSTEYIQVSDLDTPPTITFCPRQRVERQILIGLGYENWYGDSYSYHLLAGKDIRIF